MTKTGKNLTLILYFIIHFIVDFSCLFYFWSRISSVYLLTSKLIPLAVLYNFLAFALPMLIGIIADHLDRNGYVAAAGCFLILIVYIANFFVKIVPGSKVTYTIAPLLACILLGVGNGLFHIGAGRQVLTDADGKYSGPGIFIASGALGVYLGKSFGNPFYSSLYYIILAGLTLFFVLLMVRAVRMSAGYRKQKNTVTKSLGIRFEKSDYKGMCCPGVVLLFAVVIIRSFYGCVVTYTWNNTFLTGLIFTFSVFAGKFIGGIVADWLGIVPATIISLGGAGILVLFSAESPVTGCLAILLFNMTMPLTLTLLSEFWKKFPGFAFGTLMMALFLGTLPTMVFHLPHISSYMYACLMCLISLGMLLCSIFNKR